MGMEQFRAPALPLAPMQYERQYFDKLISILRLYFNQIDSDAACKAYSYRATKFYGGDLEAANVVADTATVQNAIIDAATVGHVDFNQSNASPDVMARLRWNNIDETLNLGLQYGVILQIGQELYARVQNNTGVLIPNGTVVGFAGAGAGNSLSIAPYLADGNTSTLYVLGVMTHDLPDTGELGYCTVWGNVHGFDTTGAPVGETWAQGDVLYASPTIAGAFTNVKPTAPANVIPMAAVTNCSSTGNVFVRPTIEQQKYYGVFSDATTQTAATIYTPQAITFDTTDIAKGFSRGTPTSSIVAANAGLYNFQFSAQITSGSASAKNIWIWPRVNGVDVQNSNSQITISGANSVLVPSWNWVLSLTAGQYFEIMFAVDDLNVQVLSVAAQTGANGTATFARPAVPSIILTVTQVQQ